MGEIKILIEGYRREKGNVVYTTSTTVLIMDCDLYILVDPGTDKEALLKSLRSEGLKFRDIDVVLVTHCHLDYLLNIRLFPEKDIYCGNIVIKDPKIVRIPEKIPNTNVLVIPTPGHSNDHCSLLVKTEKGNVVIAGDLFYWKENEEPKIDIKNLVELNDPFAKDRKALIESRKKVLKIADYIIPGHGKFFKVPRC